MNAHSSSPWKHVGNMLLDNSNPKLEQVRADARFIVAKAKGEA